MSILSIVLCFGTPIFLDEVAADPIEWNCNILLLDVDDNPIQFEPITITILATQESITVSSDPYGEISISEDDFANPLYDGEGIEMSSEDYNIILLTKAFASVLTHNILFKLAHPDSLSLGYNTLKMGKISIDIRDDGNGNIIKDENIIITQNTANSGVVATGTVTSYGYYQLKDSRDYQSLVYQGACYQEQYLVKGTNFYKPTNPTVNCGPWNCTFDSTNPPQNFNIYTSWTMGHNLPSGASYTAYMNMFNWDENNGNCVYDSGETKYCDGVIKRMVTVATSP